MCDRSVHHHLFESGVPQPPHSPGGEVVLVEDGAMDGYQGFNGVKVVHVLKEPTIDMGLTIAADRVINAGTTPHCVGCIDSKQNDLWTTVARRSLALQSLRQKADDRLLDFDELVSRRCDYASALRRSAIFNLNDTIPRLADNEKRSTSVRRLLKQMARLRWTDHQSGARGQGTRIIELIQTASTLGHPHVLVCGGDGTFDLFLELLASGGCQNPFRAVTHRSNGFALLRRDDTQHSPIPVIRARHPALRYITKQDEYDIFERRCHRALTAAAQGAMP